MLRTECKLKTRLRVYPGVAAWYFVSVPKKQSAAIKKTFTDFTRGFGSLKVKAVIGLTSWETSIFPNSKTGMYMLPIKALVRKKEKIAEHKIIPITLTIKI